MTRRSCPRCLRKLGIESILFESPTLTDARETLARVPIAQPGIPSQAGDAAAAT